MSMRTIELKKFLRDVRDRHTLQRAKPFCFVLGAGASKQSGIPMSGELVDRWLKVLHEDANHNGESIDQWASAKTLGIKSFEYARRGEFYGQIYARRFAGAHDTGHAELQSLLSGKEPSFGYSILAYILANTPHKAVITTNFDNLVADGLYLYSNTAPILCVHESLAAFITAQLDRPLVVKIHRDLLLNPRNADDEIDQLDKAWDAPLRSLFSHFTPIFVGYGGNDGSLMGFLEKLEPPVPDRIYWCVRPDSPPNARVNGLLDKRDGTLVTISGFDELMFALKAALDIPDLLPDLNDRHKIRVERYTKQFTDLNGSARKGANAPNATTEQKTLGEAATAAVKELEKDDTPDTWILRAKAEPDTAKAEALFRQALEKHPNNGDLTCAYGLFLADKKQDFVEAERLIKSSYEADPENADRLQDYGIFLWKNKGEAQKAEELLIVAVAKHTAILGAEHLSTLKSRNNLANALGDQGKSTKAEQEHRAVLAIRQRVLGSEHPDTLSSRRNLAIALDDQGKYSEAEQEFRAVLAIRQRVMGAEHPDTLRSRNNLAEALRAQGKNAESEQEHRAVLAIRERVLGSKHPDVFQSCYNLALCLEVQKKFADALVFMQRAEAGWTKVWGPEHLRTKNAKVARERIEAALK